LSRAPGKNQEKKLILFRQNSSIAAQADFFELLLTALNNFTFGYSHSGFTGGKPCP
jgi:hypothetical protein